MYFLLIFPALSSRIDHKSHTFTNNHVAEITIQLEAEDFSGLPIQDVIVIDSLFQYK